MQLLSHSLSRIQRLSFHCSISPTHVQYVCQKVIFCTWVGISVDSIYLSESVVFKEWPRYFLMGFVLLKVPRIGCCLNLYVTDISSDQHANYGWINFEHQQHNKTGTLCIISTNWVWKILHCYAAWLTNKITTSQRTNLLLIWFPYTGWFHLPDHILLCVSS